VIEENIATAGSSAGFSGMDFLVFQKPVPPAMPAAFSWSGKGLAPWQLRRVAQHVLAHLDRPISLSELAELVRLSRFHFCTAFRRATGKTPCDWVTSARIARAIELLEAREMSITEIALEVGYETPSSFTARFRQRTGLTPSEFRRSL
jgi:AraC family transcriptional regulator